MSDATADMSLQESCVDAARHLSVEVHLLASKTDELERENAKLRELVEDMLDCIDIQIAFERVPARWMQDEFAGRARELGIEVTD